MTIYLYFSYELFLRLGQKSLKKFCWLFGKCQITKIISEIMWPLEDTRPQHLKQIKLAFSYKTKYFCKAHISARSLLFMKSNIYGRNKANLIKKIPLTFSFEELIVKYTSPLIAEIFMKLWFLIISLHFLNVTVYNLLFNHYCQVGCGISNSSKQN